jgi:hypothetical protein
MIRAPFLTQLGPNDVLIGSYLCLSLCSIGIDSAHTQCHPDDCVLHFSHCCRRQAGALPPM